MLRKVYLYGDLAEKFGPEFEFDMDSFFDCVKALQCAFKDFKRTISPNEYALFVDNQNINKDCINLNLGPGDFHIFPKVFGANKIMTIGAIEFVIGALLVVGGLFLEGISAGTSTFMVQAGIALMVGGSVMMLMSGLFPDLETEAARKSFIFSNIANSAKQGDPVPICYGEHLVGSIVVSGSLDVEDLSDDYSVTHSLYTGNVFI